MHRDLHVDYGTRIINRMNGKLGRVSMSLFGKVEYDEICVTYDDAQGGCCVDRYDIEREGTPEFDDNLRRWHPELVADAPPKS